MDRDAITLHAERTQLAERLALLSTSARIRPASAFHPLDEASFYAENGVSEFCVFVSENVTWGPQISHYVEEPDDMRRFRRMTIDVANDLAGHDEAVQKLFEKWFEVGE